jgi:hypothetical protein
MLPRPRTVAPGAIVSVLSAASLFATPSVAPTASRLMVRPAPIVASYS